MDKYIIWTTAFDDIMVEVLNEGDIVEVQKELLDQGYIIVQTCIGVFETSTFIRVIKLADMENITYKSS